MKICITIAVQAVFVGLFLGGVYYLKQASPNRDDAKLEEIKEQLTKIPIYPSFQKVGEHYTSRHIDAAVYLHYRSNADAGSVRAFYFTELTKLGWKINEKADPPYFQNNDLRLYIECRPDQNDWNYALNVVWRNPDIQVGLD